MAPQYGRSQEVYLTYSSVDMTPVTVSDFEHSLSSIFAVLARSKGPHNFVSVIPFDVPGTAVYLDYVPKFLPGTIGTYATTMYRYTCVVLYFTVPYVRTTNNASHVT